MKDGQKLQTWRLTTLTPLHIGDGEELQLNMDYLQRREGLDVYDFEALLDQAAMIPGAVNEIGKSQFDLERFIKQYRLAGQTKYHLPFSGRQKIHSLRSFIKDGLLGRPYIPGSSIKGCMRTALWVITLDRTRLPGIHDLNGYQRAVARLGGASPHEDFLRPLQVSDSIPTASEDVLQAQEVKFLNILQENSPGWIDFASRRQNKPSHQEATGIVVEAVKENQQFYFSAAIDAFLQTSFIQKAARMPHSQGLSSEESFCRTMNAHAIEIAGKEKHFFEQFQPETKALVTFYKALQKTILSVSQNSRACILRLGWGSGWKGMTGDWLNEQDLRAIRPKTRPKLGRQGVALFPKTRRLAVKDGIPCRPFGWVQLELDKPQTFKRKTFTTFSQIPKPQAPEVKQQPVVTAHIPEPKKPEKSPEDLRAEKVAAFEQHLKTLPAISSQIDDLLQRIGHAEDQEMKKDMVSALIAAARKVKNFKKKRQAGKQWVNKIEALAEEVGLQV